MMWDGYESSTNYDKKRMLSVLLDDEGFNKPEYIDKIRYAIINSEPLFGSYNLDNLIQMLREGMSFGDLLITVGRVLKKNKSLEFLKRDISSRYDELRYAQHPTDHIFHYDLDAASLFTVLRAVNTIITIFDGGSRGRLFLGYTVTSDAGLANASGNTDISALFMLMQDVPHTVRTIDILTYPFINSRIRVLSSDDYITELKRNRRGLPKEEWYIVDEACRCIPHFIATSLWYNSDLSYGATNRLRYYDPSHISDEKLLVLQKEKSRMAILTTMLSVILVPIVYFYNTYLIKKWGWDHHYAVGSARSRLFARTFIRVFPSFSFYLKKNNRAFLETLALSFKNTLHMLPDERSHYIKKIVRLIKRQDILDDELVDISQMITNVENMTDVDPHLQNETLLMLSALDAHYGEKLKLTPNMLATAYYWLCTVLLGEQHVHVRYNEMNKDIARWLAV